MYVLGVDVGTTGTKAVLVNSCGETVSCSYKGYKLLRPCGDYVNQNSDDWWNALEYTVNDCTRAVKDKENIAAIAISSQGGSLVPVDRGGRPLCEALVWMDSRGRKQHSDMLKAGQEDFFYGKTGWKLNIGLNLVKTKWLKDNCGDIFKNTYKFLSTVDYINYKLTGRFAIDHTNAAMTQLMDIGEGCWDGALLELAGIDTDKLPQIERTGKVIGTLTPEAASRLGLNTGAAVVSGAHDQYSAALGAGATAEGDMIVSTGTAWVALGITGRPLYDTGTYIAHGRHVLEGLWGALTSVPAGGASMEWFKENLGMKLQKVDGYDTESFKDIDRNAEMCMGKTGELFFYPYFSGSGLPHWNSGAKASFLGIGIEHGRYDMALAVMEGVVFETRMRLDELRNKGCCIKRLKVMGGATRSRLWTEMLAAAAGCSVIKLNEPNAACLGAAAIAGAGCGMFGGLIEGAQAIRKTEVPVEPEKSMTDYYGQKYLKYRKGIDAVDRFYSGISM